MNKFSKRTKVYDRGCGFTIIELMVVVMIIGILAMIVLPQYTKTIESSKADQAVSTVQMVATTNRMFALDHNGIYTDGTLADPGSASPGSAQCDPAAICPNAPDNGANYFACDLIACKYLAAQVFNNQPYTYQASNNVAAGSCGAAGIIACCARNAVGAPGAPYNGWGYTVGTNGNINIVGNAPTPPST